jgi:hypothetical protein
MLLNITHEEVETVPTGLSTLSTMWRRMTLRLRNTEIEERAKMIADLEQQLLELRVQAPLKPVDHQDTDAMLGIDED